MSGRKKRYEMDPAAEGGYTFRDKIKPFLSGLLEGAPLVEVAVEGIRRGVGGGLKHEYVIRVAANGTTEQIHAAMLAGLEANLQDLMAKAFQQRYWITLADISRKVEGAESGMNGHNLVREGGEYVIRTMEQATRLLRSGKISAERAQIDLASMIFADGTEEQAREALADGRVTSGFARNILTFKCGAHKGYEA